MYISGASYARTQHDDLLTDPTKTRRKVRPVSPYTPLYNQAEHR